HRTTGADVDPTWVTATPVTCTCSICHSALSPPQSAGAYVDQWQKDKSLYRRLALITARNPSFL
ncbi:hypothetical protein NEUTE1DRAFT_49983, partial [Neurospora tetrasperma FGSC 2508]